MLRKPHMKLRGGRRLMAAVVVAGGAVMALTGTATAQAATTTPTIEVTKAVVTANGERINGSDERDGLFAGEKVTVTLTVKELLATGDRCAQRSETLDLTSNPEFAVGVPSTLLVPGGTCEASITFTVGTGASPSPVVLEGEQPPIREEVQQRVRLLHWTVPSSKLLKEGLGGEGGITAVVNREEPHVVVVTFPGHESSPGELSAIGGETILATVHLGTLPGTSPSTFCVAPSTPTTVDLEGWAYQPPKEGQVGVTPSSLSVPETMIVPAGKCEASFTIQTTKPTRGAATGEIVAQADNSYSFVQELATLNP
jgi:hypothetical protein